MTGDLLDLLAETEPRPVKELHIDPERGHVAITVEPRPGGALGPRNDTFVFLTDLGGTVQIAAYPNSAWLSPTQAREIAEHLQAFAERHDA